MVSSFFAITGTVLFIIAIFVYVKNRSSVKKNSESFEVLQGQYHRLSIAHAKAEQALEHHEQERMRMQTIFETENNRLRLALDKERAEHQETQKSLQHTAAFFNAQAEKITEQKIALEQIRTQFNQEFELIANKILEEKTQKFTETNTRNLDQILHPFKENIKSFEEKVEKAYKMESDERHTLKGVINTLVDQSKQIQNEANNLTRALKGDQKKQGNWGEIILERILERSGLEKNREYRTQSHFTDENGNRRQPDVIIDLPDNKNIIIDAKVSLIAYERWINSEDEQEKKLFAKQHTASIRNHIVGLSSKNYCDLYTIHSPDFVLLFIPIESSFSLSVSEDHDIFNFAWERRVVIVSPSTLFATLRTISALWKQEKQNRNVLEIAREAGLLYDKFVAFTEDMEKMEKQIFTLSKTHENARKKLDTGKGNMVSKIEKLKKLGANTTKILQPASPIADDDV